MTCLFVIDIALAEGNFAKYYAVKTQLELQNIEEQEELANYNDFYSVYSYILENNVLPRDLDILYLDVLAAIANIDETAIGIKAKTLHSIAKGTFSHYPVEFPNVDEYRRAQRPSNESLVLENFIKNNDVSLSPNPTKNLVFINTEINISKFIIVDVNGKEVARRKYHSSYTSHRAA